MRRRKYTVRVVWVKRHGPYPAAGELHLFGIDTFPLVTRIGRNKNTAVSLECTRNQNLISIVGIDQNTRKITQRKITPASYPGFSVIPAHIKRLNGPDVDVIRTFRIGRDRSDGNVVNGAARFLPMFYRRRVTPPRRMSLCQPKWSVAGRLIRGQRRCFRSPPGPTTFFPNL